MTQGFLDFSQPRPQDPQSTLEEGSQSDPDDPPVPDPSTNPEEGASNRQDTSDGDETVSEDPPPAAAMEPQVCSGAWFLNVLDLFSSL